MKFKTEVVETVKRARDVKSVRFWCPPSFNYDAGQFLFINIQCEERDLTKHLTISSSPTENDFIELTKKLTGHPFSNAFDALEIGDKVEIDAPYGNFILDQKTKKLGMISGGIGITPLRSICRYATDLKLETSIILLYGNNTLEDIVFKEDFDRMEKENRNLRIVYTLITPPPEWKDYVGYINADMIRKEVPDYASRVFYTCGPPAMVGAMKKLLKDFNLNQKQIKTENFSGY